MTPEEIITELERFKDRVNQDGKAMLDRLKDALMPYLNAPEKIVEKVIEKTVLAEGDRRGEPRDPAEHDQHVAEELGYVPKPHHGKK